MFVIKILTSIKLMFKFTAKIRDNKTNSIYNQ
jgi:hypothetical protein